MRIFLICLFLDVATNAHHPHLPVSEVWKGRGEGWRVLPIGGHGCSAPRREQGAVLRGRGEKALIKDLTSERVVKRTESVESGKCAEKTCW